MAIEPIIRFATTPADYTAFGEVCRAYVDWCRARYSALPWFVEEVFGHQALEAELEILADRYGPPSGRTMIALLDGEIVAGGAFKRLEDGICELKRLYVTDRARGHGLGRKLSEALINAAKAEGYAVMRLDTGDLLKEAIALYASMGFRHIPPYLTYPERLAPHLIFMEKAL